jgi:uncharacterized RDD family membrane protein YckC
VVAYLIDALLLSAAGAVPLIFWVIYFAREVSKIPSGSPTVELPASVWWWFLAVMAILFIISLYRPICEYKWGKTIGKKLMGIKVVMEDGSRITGKAAVIRFLLLMIDGVFYGVVGLAAMALDESGRNRRLGDRVAKTVVIEEPGQEAQQAL